MFNETNSSVNQTILNYFPKVEQSTQLFFSKILPSILLWFLSPFWLFMLKRKTYPFKFRKSWNFIFKNVKY
jgi:hypothetical protein